MLRWIILLSMVLSVPVLAKGTYQTPQEFLAETFAGDAVVPQKLWLTAPLKQQAEDILGHELRGLRMGYWGDAQRSAWIMDEIGKEQPITVGIVISEDKIERVKVLIFRETRGWEVRYPFFTDQFKGLNLTPEQRLSGYIDGITGATLSVRALTRLGRLALLLHAAIPQ